MEIFIYKNVQQNMQYEREKQKLYLLISNWENR